VWGVIVVQWWCKDIIAYIIHAISETSLLYYVIISWWYMCLTLCKLNEIFVDGDYCVVGVVRRS
jgi:hypothetical protein